MTKNGAWPTIDRRLLVGRFANAIADAGADVRAFCENGPRIFGLRAIETCQFKHGDALAYLNNVCAALIAFRGGVPNGFGFATILRFDQPLHSDWDLGLGEGVGDELRKTIRMLHLWFMPRRLNRNERVKVQIAWRHPEWITTRDIFAARTALADLYATTGAIPHNDAPAWLHAGAARRLRA